MKVMIEFEMDNAAFEDDPEEVGTVLAQAQAKLGSMLFDLQVLTTSQLEHLLRDSNGNTVGRVRVVR